MTSRRAFLSRLGSTGSLVAAALNSDGLSLMARASEQARGRSAAELAADEDFWREIQLGFTLDRTIVNLNNGGVCAEPAGRARGVQALPRSCRTSRPCTTCGRCSSRTSRRSGAGWRASVGCDPEEIAITRNASEALQIAQLGIDLAPGDEVLTTNQDYGRDARHLGAARAPRRHRPEEDPLPGAAALAGRPRAAVRARP